MIAKFLINGQITEGQSTTLLDLKDPSSGEIIGKYYYPTTEDVNLAVISAHNTFHRTPWPKSSMELRSKILFYIAEKIKERSAELIEIEIKDSGSTFKKAKADVINTSQFFKMMGQQILKLNLHTPLISDSSKAGFSINSRQYMPIGVCAQIIPWNFPLVMAGWKIAPIIAAGCTTVLKTAEQTPLSAMMLGEIINSCTDLPAGVINIISGGADIGTQLVSHPLINKIAFTGSTSVGIDILNKAAKHIKKTTLELGGKSANIILDDANLDQAIDASLYAFLYHQGQACTSGTRLLIQENIFEEFKNRFLNRIKEVKIRPTSDKNAGMGPVLNEIQFNRIMNFIDVSKKEGAKLLYGGNRITGPEFNGGFFIEPTAFEITDKNTIFHQEIFGPVVGIIPFKTDEDAIRIANHSKYGLAGAVWSKNNDRAAKIAMELQTGTVWINEYHLLNPSMPFGGFKESGIGREMGNEGIMNYLEVKHLFTSDTGPLRSDKPWYDFLF